MILPTLRRLLSLLVLSLAILNSFSQQLISEKEDLNWNIISSEFISRHAHLNNSVSYGQGLGGFRASQVRIGENESAAIVSIDGKEYGVMKFDDKMNVKWQTILPGKPFLIYHFFDDVLVFVRTGRAYNEISELFFLNQTTGKIRKQEKFYNNEKFGITSPETNFYPLYNAATNTYNLCIRHFDKKEKELTLAINLISFDKDYNVVSNEVIPVLNSGYFIDCSLNNNGDFVLLSMSETGNMIAQAFEAKTWIPKEKIPLHVEIKEKSKYRAGLRSSVNSNNVLAFVEYQNPQKESISTVFKLNTSTGSSLKYEANTGKSAVKNISKEYRSPKNEISKPNFGDWDNVNIVEIIDSEERIIIFRETIIAYRTDYKEYVTTGDAYINILDAKMQPITNVIIPKKIHFNGLAGLSSSLHLHNNKLYILSGIDKRTREALLTIIDINAGKINSMEILEKQKIKAGFPIEPRATIWFKDRFAVSFLDLKVGSKRKYRSPTNLQLYKY